MIAALRRGACPSLSAPMPTGDGLLVRLGPANGALSPRQLGAVAEAAGRYGNGILEITARGRLQIRGLTATSADRLRDAVDALGMAVHDGVPVDSGPLAGLDPSETADPRSLADDIRLGATALGLAARLGPKVSVTVDGGGALPIGGIAADVKLDAPAGGPKAHWRVSIGGNASSARVLGLGAAAAAREAAIAILACLADRGPAARARDLGPGELAQVAAALIPAAPPAVPMPVHPIGGFPLRDGTLAQGFGLAFGQTTSRQMLQFAAAAEGASEIRLAPGRGILALGLSPASAACLAIAAARFGMVTDRDDPRLRIVACAGAPACASAHLATKALAGELAGARSGLLGGAAILHLSGCSKRCAQPSGPTVTLIGNDTGCTLVAEGTTVTAPTRDFLLGLSRRYMPAQLAEHR